MGLKVSDGPLAELAGSTHGPCVHHANERDDWDRRPFSFSKTSLVQSRKEGLTGGGWLATTDGSAVCKLASYHKPLRLGSAKVEPGWRMPAEDLRHL